MPLGHLPAGKEEGEGDEKESYIKLMKSSYAFLILPPRGPGKHTFPLHHKGQWKNTHLWSLCYITAFILKDRLRTLLH